MVLPFETSLLLLFDQICFCPNYRDQTSFNILFDNLISLTFDQQFFQPQFLWGGQKSSLFITIQAILKNFHLNNFSFSHPKFFFFFLSGGGGGVTSNHPFLQHDTIWSLINKDEHAGSQVQWWPTGHAHLKFGLQGDHQYIFHIKFIYFQFDIVYIYLYSQIVIIWI